MLTESLSTLLERGGFFCGLEGTTPRETLGALVNRLTLPSCLDLDRKALLAAVLEREDLMPTAAGHGIALPHPRNPLLKAEDRPFVAAGLTKHPLDWQALDGEPVRTLFLIVSSTAKSHLHTLSRLSYLCSQEPFHQLLKTGAAAGAGADALKHYIAEAEKTWIR